MMIFWQDLNRHCFFINAAIKQNTSTMQGLIPQAIYIERLAINADTVASQPQAASWP